jgi:argininosuccinate lyase
VAVDIRLYLRDKSEEVLSLIKSLVEVVVDQAEQNAESVFLFCSVSVLFGA